jgi:hypothetical protein
MCATLQLVNHGLQPEECGRETSTAWTVRQARNRGDRANRLLRQDVCFELILIMPHGTVNTH